MDQEICTKCGCKEIGRGKLLHNVMPINHKLTTGSPLILSICTNCGEVLSMKVEKSEVFKVN